MLQEYLVGSKRALIKLDVVYRCPELRSSSLKGLFSSTGVPTDMAIDGDGFFVVKEPGQQQSPNMFTRAGQFRFDKDGFMVSQSGARVQGYNSSGDGNLSGVLSDMQIENTNLAPKASTSLDLSMNLDPNAEVIPWGLRPNR